MRQFVLLVLLCAFTMLVMRQASAQPGVVKETPKRTSRGDVARMTEQLHLTEAQQTQINEKMIALQAALENWDKLHQDQLDALQEDMKTAKQSGKKDEMQQLQAQIQALQNERSAIQTKGQQEITAVLTPEQQVMQAALRLYEQGDFITIRKMVPLTPEQEAMLKEQAKTYAAAQANWAQENGEKAKQLEAQIREAQAALAALRIGQEKLAADNRTAIFAILTPEQKNALAATRVLQEILGRLRKMRLADDQLGKLKQLCAATAQEIGQLPDTDTQTRGEAMDKLYQSLYNEILTDAQRAELQQNAEKKQNAESKQK